MDDVVSQLRSKMSAHTLDEESGSGVERVERVLRWGSGHVLVTAKDVASATRLVEIALANVNYFRLARVSAICEDPHEPMTKVLTAGGEMIMDSGFVELNNQMQALVEQAGKMGQCIFVIVEDGDQASVEQLERLRTTLDPGQEAIERLRLIIVGTKKVAKVLEDYAVRGLASRIGARIDDAANTKRRRRKSQPNVPGPAQQSSRFRSFVMTAASGTLMATVAIGILQPQLAPTVPVDLLKGLETHVSELAISFDSIEGSGGLLSEETKDQLTSAAELSLKMVHGKGVAHAESEDSYMENASSGSSANDPTPVRVAAKPSPRPQRKAPVKRTLPAFASPAEPGIKIAAKPSAQTAPPVSKWHPKPGPEGYVLQVASFSELGNATALKAKLAGSIDRVFIKKFEGDGRTLFRVRVGAFPTIEDSTASAEALRAAGYAPVYVR